MSVFRRGLKLSQGALADELDDSSGSESEGLETKDDESEEEDQDEDSDEEDRVSHSDEEAEEEEESNSRRRGATRDADDDEGEADVDDEDPGQVKYPVVCSLCNKTLFNLDSVNQHMKSKDHLKKEALAAKAMKQPLTAEKIARLKARSEQKRQRRLAKKKQVRESAGHVWGQHVKPAKNPGKDPDQVVASKKPLGGSGGGRQTQGPRKESSPQHLGSPSHNKGKQVKEVMPKGLKRDVGALGDPQEASPKRNKAMGGEDVGRGKGSKGRPIGQTQLQSADRTGKRSKPTQPVAGRPGPTKKGGRNIDID